MLRGSHNIGVLCHTAVEMKVRGFEYLVFISPVYVPEMTALQVTQEGLLVGASCCLTDIRDKMQELIGKLPGNTL